MKPEKVWKRKGGVAVEGTTAKMEDREGKRVGENERELRCISHCDSCCMACMVSL